MQQPEATKEAAKILDSARDNLNHSERVLEQVDAILGTQRDAKPTVKGEPDVTNPLATIQLDLDTTRDNLTAISEMLLAIKQKIW